MGIKLQKQIEVIDWGLIDYRKAFSRQEKLVQEIIEKKTSEKLVFCSHPPIVTLGRGTKPGDVFAWTGDSLEVNRGGRATYHGPSQIIAYPLICLDSADDFYTDKKVPPRDLHEYMRTLEQSVQLLLKDLGITSDGRSVQTQAGEEAPDEATGVWVGSQKIAAIGIAVKRWITSHGIALNVFEDPQAFQGLYPCGFQTSQVVNLQKLSGQIYSREHIQQMWKAHLMKVLFL